MVQYQCNHCKAELESKLDMVGKSDVCPLCKRANIVPHEEPNIFSRVLHFGKEKKRLAVDKKMQEQKLKDAETRKYIETQVRRNQTIREEIDRLKEERAFSVVYDHIILLDSKRTVGIDAAVFQDEVGELHAEITKFDAYYSRFEKVVAEGAVRSPLQSVLSQILDSYMEAIRLKNAMMQVVGQQRGGGFIGGGFGVEGVVEGMAIAGILNALTDNSGKIKRALRDLQIKQDRVLEEARGYTELLKSLSFSGD